MSKNWKNLLYTFFSFGMLFPTITYAQSDEPPPQISPGTIDGFLNDVVYKYIFPLGGLICFGFIIMGGYMWMMSAGDPDKIKQAQGTLTWSVIGLMVVIIARLLIGVIMDAIA